MFMKPPSIGEITVYICSAAICEGYWANVDTALRTQTYVLLLLILALFCCYFLLVT